MSKWSFRRTYYSEVNVLSHNNLDRYDIDKSLCCLIYSNFGAVLTRIVEQRVDSCTVKFAKHKLDKLVLRS